MAVLNLIRLKGLWKYSVNRQSAIIWSKENIISMDLVSPLKYFIAELTVVMGPSPI